MTFDDPFLTAFDALPTGTFVGEFRGLRWVAAKTAFAGGRSFKLVAEEAGGACQLSANLYRFEDGRALLKPCEIEAAVVRDFVLGLSVA